MAAHHPAEDRLDVGQIVHVRSRVTPRSTHRRFILSHALLRSESCAGPLRGWLGSFSPRAMLILDEAHNAAPSSGGKYAVDSRLTKTVRDIAPRFDKPKATPTTPQASLGLGEES